jgi:peptidoglycan hydrolase CwlO-like protein
MNIMKKLFGILSIIALFGMFSCQSGITQEEVDKLNAQIVEKDALIAQLEDEIDFLSLDLEECLAENEELKAPKKTTTTAKKPATTPAPTTTVKPTETPETKDAGGRRGTETETKTGTGRRG